MSGHEPELREVIEGLTERPPNLPLLPIKKARIRYFFFMRSEKNRAAMCTMTHCPCGTQGSCEVCVGPSEFLYERWRALSHPWHWLFKTKRWRRQA